jgi:hypothetical protein
VAKSKGDKFTYRPFFVGSMLKLFSKKHLCACFLRSTRQKQLISTNDSTRQKLVRILAK